jgi:hypothetical protein
LVRNPSAFTTLFAPDKSWDNVRTSVAPYTKSRLAHLLRNKCVGFPVVEQIYFFSVLSSAHVLLSNLSSVHVLLFLSVNQRQL